MPDGIIDRAADVWEPLLAIADLAGGPLARARPDTRPSTSTPPATPRPILGVHLLADCRRIFDRQDVDRLTTETLLEALDRARRITVGRPARQAARRPRARPAATQVRRPARRPPLRRRHPEGLPARGLPRRLEPLPATCCGCCPCCPSRRSKGRRGSERRRAATRSCCPCCFEGGGVGHPITTQRHRLSPPREGQQGQHGRRHARHLPRLRRRHGRQRPRRPPNPGPPQPRSRMTI